MSYYKDFEKKYLGYSDVAALTIQCAAEKISENPYSLLGAFILEFGSDGNYYAYIVHGDAEIGGHYSLVKTIENCAWIRVFDDDSKQFEYYLSSEKNTLKIWRAGDYTCIFQFC